MAPGSKPPLESVLKEVASPTASSARNGSFDRSSVVEPAVRPPNIAGNMRESTPTGKAHTDLERLVDAISPTDRNSQLATTKPAVSNTKKASAANTCATCNEPIFEIDQAITAIGKMFHHDHFQCGQCTKQLTGGIFFEREGRPFCEKCMNETFLLPKCAYCGENIKGKCINALNKNWHPDHFFCSQCGKHFPPGAGFLERDGKAYCEEDYYNMFAPKCGSCDQAITDEVVTALGKSFHASCFVCAEPGCKFPLTNGGSFFDYNGKPYCETHYHAARGSLCGSCQKPITGRCLTAIGKRFHPEHFVCAFCKRQLGTTGAATNQGSQATFKDKDGKPYCIACFMKLYG